MNKDSQNVRSVPFVHENLTGKVLSILQDRIIRREWMPKERIYVHQLSKEFNISQTPIREALYKLEGMNLVTIEPQKGMYVASFSKQDVLDTLQIRIALEDVATQRISQIPEDLVEKMKDSLHLFGESIKARNLVANNEIDRLFHLLIIEAANSRQLTRVYENLHSHLSIERLLYQDEKRALSELITTEKEHSSIIQAFENKDRKEIRKAVRGHLNNVRRRITRIIEGTKGD